MTATKVLVVDDEPTVREVVVGYLRRDGHDVAEAGDGTVALELLDADPPDLVVLDIRTPEEFASGHLANAINIDYYADDFESKLAELDLEVPYVMYCNSGNRSSNALPVMDSLGFAEVYELDGGIQAWYSAGLTVEQ